MYRFIKKEVRKNQQMKLIKDYIKKGGINNYNFMKVVVLKIMTQMLNN